MFLLTVSRRCFFVDHLLHVCFMCVFHIVLYVPCSPDVTRWEKTDLYAPLLVMFSCVYFFFIFSHGVLGHVWYLTVSIPDLCLLPNIVLFLYLLSSEYSYGILIYINSGI